MATRQQRNQQTTFRELREDELQAYWYAPLPDDRPAKRHPRVSEEEWRPIVDDLIEHRPDGDYMANVFEDIKVGSPAWNKMLTHRAIGMQRRLFWEPLHSVGLTEEGARRYGVKFQDYVRDANKAARTAAKKATKAAAKEEQRHKGEENMDFREADKDQYWYVDNLSPNRPVKRQAMSRDRWIATVRKLHEVDRHGKRYMMTLNGEVDIDGDGKADWKATLRETILGGGFRMFWEPKPPKTPRAKSEPLW